MSCPICGKSESLKHCASCKRVNYCSREHQRQHWKVHRAECTFQSKPSEMLIVVEIKNGEGDGLANPLINHLFDSRVEATNYVRQRLGYPQSGHLRKLTQMPFLTELLGFSSASLYVDPHYNAFPPFTKEFIDRYCFGLYYLNEGYHCFGPNGTVGLNGMAIFLGCRVDDGFSRFLNARGDSFFIGSTSKHQPVTGNLLWGAANMLSEAMPYYDDEDLEVSARNDMFRKWSREYLLGTWQPAAGNGGVDLYETNPFRCAVRWPVVDHRTPKVTLTT